MLRSIPINGDYGARSSFSFEPTSASDYRDEHSFVFMQIYIHTYTHIRHLSTCLEHFPQDPSRREPKRIPARPFHTSTKTQTQTERPTCTLWGCVDACNLSEQPSHNHTLILPLHVHTESAIGQARGGGGTSGKSRVKLRHSPPKVSYLFTDVLHA